ncbi:MAG: ParA family protein [Acidimicrobiia bacterium]|jgi:chromosome partitioning protein|nr:ParA family protein [Acidimicrobiia bacterium]
MAIIAATNQKGGVGKTSSCHHLAGALATMGRRVLLIDDDPQASLSQGLLGPLTARQLDPSGTLAAIYRGDDPYPEQVVRPSGVDGVDLIAGSRDINDFNLPRPFEAPYEQQTCLRSWLDAVRDDYEYILIDSPPNLGLCTWAAMVAADGIVVPLQAEDYGAQGVMDVQDAVEMVRAGPNPGLRILGYLITMYSSRKTVHRLYEKRLRELYGRDVLGVMVPHAADFPEAIAARKPVAAYKPKGAAAKAIRDLAAELEARLVHGVPEVV